MRLNKMLVYLFLPFAAMVIDGCAKGEGEGGAATIRGKVMVQDYTLSGNKNGSPYPGADVKVYLIYGNGTTYADDYDCSYDGSYEFKNLRKGTYKVFVYQDIIPEPADPPNEEAVIEQVIISDKKGVVTVPDLEINQY